MDENTGVEITMTFSASEAERLWGAIGEIHASSEETRRQQQQALELMRQVVIETRRDRQTRIVAAVVGGVAGSVTALLAVAAVSWLAAG